MKSHRFMMSCAMSSCRRRWSLAVRERASCKVKVGVFIGVRQVKTLQASM